MTDIFIEPKISKQSCERFRLSLRFFYKDPYRPSSVLINRVLRLFSTAVSKASFITPSLIPIRNKERKERKKERTLCSNWVVVYFEGFTLKQFKIISFLKCTYSKAKHDRQRMYKRNIEARSRNNCWRGKANSITYSQCVFVALVIQHAKRMRHITLSSLSCLAVQIFFDTIS